jgi:hypothetical protein
MIPSHRVMCLSNWSASQIGARKHAVQCISIRPFMPYGNAMNLPRLRHIVAVARDRSVSRAAEEAGITLPALSRSVAACEQRHPPRLFDRGRSGVHPTAAGLPVIDPPTKLLAARGTCRQATARSAWRQSVAARARPALRVVEQVRAMLAQMKG